MPRTILYNIRSKKPLTQRLRIEVLVCRYKIAAIIDSSTLQIVILLRVVERYNILYQDKEYLVLVILVDENPIGYRGGVIRLETRAVLLEVVGFKDKRYINIIDLREEDILISYNQLDYYNPNINQ